MLRRRFLGGAARMLAAAGATRAGLLRTLAATGAAGVSSALRAPARVAASEPLPNGWFYNETTGTRDQGFAVTNDDGIRIWTFFQRNGGVARLGFPVSQRWTEGPFTLQAFQKAVLQWQPGRGMYFVNIYDRLSRAGKDDWLAASKLVARPFPFPAGATEADRLALLVRDEKLRAEWYKNRNWRNAYGLPVGYEDRGAVRLLRGQRAAFRHWVATGRVERTNGGDHFKEAGLIPAAAVLATPRSRLTITSRLYVGTGEYNAARTWDAILRFENAHTLDSTSGVVYPPNGTVPVKQVEDASGVRLNFAHGLYLYESRDELFVASLFTNATNSLGPFTPSSATGSVGVIASASTASGPQTLTRHLFGPLTTIEQPHGVWVDETRDLLYVANAFAGATDAGNVLVFENASTVDGDVPPDRVIDHREMGSPIFVFADSGTDRIFVASKDDRTAASPQAAVLVFNNASTASGTVQPDVRIIGPSTRLEAGVNDTTHNVWYDAPSALLYVGHHTNEVLIFDLSSISLTPSTPTDHDLTPRVIEIHEDPTGADINAWSVYGLFLLAGADRLFVAAGHATAGSGATASSPPQAIKIYDNVSDPSVSGLVTPARVIHWMSGGSYYPPQPIWVQLHVTGSAFPR